ncbi:MAG: hypothetical protein ACFFF4_05250 [Candidatus Thorarchaeota archaeon]
MVSRRTNTLILTALFTWLIVSPYAASLLGSLSMPITIDKFVIADLSIDSPTDLTFENGTRGETITWNATTDASPLNFTVTLDGDVHDSGSWDGDLIIVDLDHIYDDNLTFSLTEDVVLHYVCQVFDTDNNTVSDEVIVTVVPDETGPIIAQPDDFTYEVGSFGHTIIWNITETNPHTYNITRMSNETTSNNTVIEAGEWNGDNISISVDGLNATRWYLYTLFVNDTLGFNSTSTVNVTVFADLTAPVISSPDDITYEFGALGHEIVWFTYDSNPLNYTMEVIVLYNDTSYGNTSAVSGTPSNITDQPWSFSDPKGLNLTFSVDRMYLGNYTFSLTLFDDFGYNSTDTVNVTIYKDVRAPVVNSTNDFSYEEGYTGYTLNWTADESNPRSYNLTKGSEILMNGTWRGENLSISVDGLPVGEHTYNMTLIDYFNQTTIVITVVTVTPDAHLPTIREISVIESYTTVSTNNVTVQAYVWDLNRISSITIEWYTSTNSTPLEKDMTAETNDFYVAMLGEFSHGVNVTYRLIAVDNSSVNNIHTTEWRSYLVTTQRNEQLPLALWGGILALGILSSLAVLWLYFRTKTR